MLRMAWVMAWAGRRSLRARVALVGSYELLMMGHPQFPGSGGRRVQDRTRRGPLRERAAALFAGQLAADRVPSVRGDPRSFTSAKPRAQRLRNYLAAGAARRAESQLREQPAGGAQANGPGSRGNTARK